MRNERLPRHVVYAPPHEDPRTVEILAYMPPAFIGDEHGWFMVREKDGCFRELSIRFCYDPKFRAKAKGLQAASSEGRADGSDTKGAGAQASQ